MRFTSLLLPALAGLASSPSPLLPLAAAASLDDAPPLPAAADLSGDVEQQTFPSSSSSSFLSTSSSTSAWPPSAALLYARAVEAAAAPLSFARFSLQQYAAAMRSMADAIAGAGGGSRLGDLDLPRDLDLGFFRFKVPAALRGLTVEEWAARARGAEPEAWPLHSLLPEEGEEDEAAMLDLLLQTAARSAAEEGEEDGGDWPSWEELRRKASELANDASESANAARVRLQRQISEAFSEENMRRARANLMETPRHLLEKLDNSAVPDAYDFFEDFPHCTHPPRDQGQCGSCWAFSATSVLGYSVCRQAEELRRTSPTSARLPESWRLSAQPLVSCADSSVCSDNGCCSGGSIYQALDWTDSHGTWAKSCAPYTSGRSQDEARDQCPNFSASCRASSNPALARRSYHAKSIRCATGEEAMKRLIHKYGPMTMTIKTASNMFGYSGDGVFTRGDAEFQKNGESHAYHAMTITGWGTENVNGREIPFWWVENSWGNTYEDMPAGRKHMMRVLRGVDEMFAESYGGCAVRTADTKLNGSERAIDTASWPSSVSSK